MDHFLFFLGRAGQQILGLTVQLSEAESRLQSSEGSTETRLLHPLLLLLFWPQIAENQPVPILLQLSYKNPKDKDPQNQSFILFPSSKAQSFSLSFSSQYLLLTPHLQDQVSISQPDTDAFPATNISKLFPVLILPIFTNLQQGF